jgi:hypothetical protein
LIRPINSVTVSRSFSRGLSAPFLCKAIVEAAARHKTMIIPFAFAFIFPSSDMFVVRYKDTAIDVASKIPGGRMWVD